MSGHSRFNKAEVIQSNWYRSLSQYEKPNLSKAVWQLLNTFIPYIALWVLMVYMIQQGFSYWLLVPPITIAGGLTVRLFIFFHDCGHGSFFTSRPANRIVGYICGVLTFTPYEEWRLAHAEHHATAGDLERRGEGDIWTMTVEEYQAASKQKRIIYWFYRSPFILFMIGPAIMFVILHRRVPKGASARERKSVIITNVALLAIVGLASVTIGLRTYLLIQIPVMALAASVGTWLFYVQHQYEGVYWAHHPEWDPIKAALDGSSYYKLPKVLQWFTGNIGLHHIHHLRPRIPNYNLQKCYNETPPLQEVKPMTLLQSLPYLGLHLWDEKNQTLISFWTLKRQLKQERSTATTWRQSPKEE